MTTAKYQENHKGATIHSIGANMRYWLAMHRAEYHVWAACKVYGEQYYALRGPKSATNFQRIYSFDKYATEAQRQAEKSKARYWLELAATIRKGGA